MRPGGKVFQVPPPAVEANVPADSTGAGWTGTAGTGVSTDWAIATFDAYVVVRSGTAARASVSAARGGGVATATAGGADSEDVDLSATCGAVEGEDFGVDFWFFASFMLFAAPFAAFPPLGATSTIFGVSTVTGLAGSTRTS
jgi:hypothetical protein